MTLLKKLLDKLFVKYNFYMLVHIK